MYSGGFQPPIFCFKGRCNNLCATSTSDERIYNDNNDNNINVNPERQLLTSEILPKYSLKKIFTLIKIVAKGFEPMNN